MLLLCKKHLFGLIRDVLGNCNLVNSYGRDGKKIPFDQSIGGEEKPSVTIIDIAIISIDISHGCS